MYDATGIVNYSALSHGNNVGDSFPVTHEVRQCGVHSSYLFALYIDDVIDNLTISGYGLYVGQLCIGCVYCAFSYVTSFMCVFVFCLLYRLI